MKKFLAYAVLIALGFVFSPTANAQQPAPAVDLKWTNPVVPYNGVRVYKVQINCSSAISFVKLIDVPTPATTITDLNVTRGSTYCYKARTYDSISGLESGDSNTAQAVVPFLPPEQPPTNLTATPR